MIVLIIEELAEKYLFARLLTRRTLLMQTHHHRLGHKLCSTFQALLPVQLVVMTQKIRFCPSFLRNALIAWFLTCLCSGSPSVEESLRSKGIVRVNFPKGWVLPPPLPRPGAVSRCSLMLLCLQRGGREGWSVVAVQLVQNSLAGKHSSCSCDCQL